MMKLEKLELIFLMKIFFYNLVFEIKLYFFLYSKNILTKTIKKYTIVILNIFGKITIILQYTVNKKDQKIK